MLPGLPAKMLKIDLSNGTITHEDLEDKALFKKYLGGRGIGTYLILSKYEPTIDPYDEKAPLIFAPGVFTGTVVPSSGRTSVIFKSPVTNKLFKTNVGGHFGSQLKFAGYDMLIIEGRAKKPVMIYINDDNVEIKDASHLWGRDIRETNHIVREELGDEDVQLACIGPAGENKVAYASIQVSIYNSAARGGGGAVMGDKNLKAIAVRGTKSVKVAHPERFMKAVSVINQKMHKSPGVGPLSDYGTSIGVESTNAIGAFPVRNFQESSIEDVKYLTGQHLVESGLLKRKIACYSCPVACHRYVTLEDGKYKGTYTGGPEYETLNSLGAGCGSVDTASVIKANEYCNILGMDTISTGGCIQWLMECKQRGVVTDEQADGLDLSWGNTDTIVALTKKIAYREGIGDLLANGLEKASQQMGKDSYKWAIQARGLEQSRVETRSAFAYALAFAISSRGPDHLNTECLAEFGGDSEALRVIKYITGSEKYAYPHTTDKRGEIVRWHEDIYSVSDSVGLCAFPTTAQFWVDEYDLAEIYSSATGIEVDADEIMLAGRRTITMERLYNAMLGYSREHDILPYRLMNEAQSNAMHKNAINSKELLDIMKDDYFTLHGWDLIKGWPTKETLNELGLDEFIAKASKYIEIA